MSISLTRITAPVLFSFSFFAGISPAVHGGNGTYSSGAFNYCVSVRFNANNTQLNRIKDTFQSGSDVLLDATDGQHRFGTVTIVNDSGASNSSEVWINSGTGRAYATYGEYGKRGSHVNLFMSSNFSQSSGALGDAYTVAHEHIHHAYGAADEYSGPSGNAEDAPLPDTANLNYSIMDNYFTRGGRSGGGTTYTLNEMCVAHNHDPDGDTWHEDFHGESVWETVAGQTRFPITAPAGLPVSAPPASQPVTFVDGFGGLRVSLAIDRSGSMSVDQRIEFGKLGAQRFVDLLADTDAVAVTSFSSSAGVNSSMSTLNPAGRAAASSAISSLSASGLTNIGGGLSAALSEISNQTSRSCNEIIILLSDGDHNTGVAPSTVLPQIKNEGVTVLTVGVGSGISTSGEATLQNIATSTGGRYYRISNASDLASVFILLAAETTGAGILAQSPIQVNSSSVSEIPVFVEQGASATTFAITKGNSGDDIELELISPSGIVYTQHSPGIDVINGPNSTILSKSNSESGIWTMRILSGLVSSNSTVNALAYALNDGTRLNLSIINDVLSYPERVELIATPMFEGFSVVGADLVGIIRRPDGTEIPIRLRDDGISPDRISNDGIYGAFFDKYTDDGTYTFEITSIANQASTYQGEDLFISVGHPSSQNLVPDFIRTASVTAVVSGIPDYAVATVEYGPETINLKSRGKYVTAYIELPNNLDVGDIDVTSVKLSSINGLPIPAIYAEARPTSIQDFDNDGHQDLMVKFDRGDLQSLLSPGDEKIELEGLVNGLPFKGERNVIVKNPGKQKGRNR